MSALTRLVDGVMDAVLSPALWLGVVLAFLCSVLFYGWRGGGWRQFGRDTVAALVGFGIGQMAGAYLQIETARLGQLQIAAGIAGAIVALFAGRLVWRQGAKTA